MDASHIYYCEKCNSTYSGNTSKNKSCEECLSPLLETTIMTDAWRNFPSEKKKRMKEAFRQGQFIRGATAPVILANSTSNSADEIKKYKELLDSGAITQQEFNAKKRQLLDLD